MTRGKRKSELQMTSGAEWPATRWLMALDMDSHRPKTFKRHPIRAASSMSSSYNRPVAVQLLPDFVMASSPPDSCHVNS